MIGIIFKPKKDFFQASISIHDMNNLLGNTNDLLEKSSSIYISVLEKMKRIIEKNNNRRKAGKFVPAKLMWKLGDEIFSLVNKLAEDNLELEDLYGHLKRDLKISRSSIEKVIIFRRYIPICSNIPPNLNWGSVRESPKKNAFKILNERKR